MNNIATEPREMLKEIVSRNGEEILQDTDRCEGLLKDHCGLHRREIAALVGALEERVPLELKSSWQGAMSPEAMRSRLVQRMQDNRGLTPDLADWAVEAWSYALGVGLGRRSDRITSVIIPEPKPQSTPKAARVANAALAAEFGAAAAFAGQHPQQAAEAVVVDAQTTPEKAPWSSQKKALAAVAAAAVIYFGVTHTPHPTPTPTPCPTGQVQMADGSCAAASKDPKIGPKVGPQNPKIDPKTPVAKAVTGLAPGTSIPVTVDESLNSDTVTIGQYVRGIVNAPVVLEGKTMVPEGTKVILQIKGVDQSGKVLGAAKIDLALVEMTIGGKKHTIAGAQAVVKGPSKTADTAKKAGIFGAIGTAVGCGIGKATKHTGAGCAAGAGGGVGTGVVVASQGKPKPVNLEAGAVVRFKLGQPVSLA